MTDNLIGTYIDNYEILSVIGTGGMGRVYKARQVDLDRVVAIKFLRQEYWTSSEGLNSLIAEAKLIARLYHPNILRVITLGKKTEGHHEFGYLVMDYAAGGSLSDKLQNRPLTPDGAKHIITQMGSALDYAHGEGVIHLDLKPQNILFGNDEHIYVADFGLSKLLESTSHIKAKTGAGTTEYMPPEQAMGGMVSYTADVYALGITLHEMLTGSRPQKTIAPGFSWELHLEDTLPNAIKEVIRRATSYDPRERFRSAGELAWSFVEAINLPSNSVVGTSFVPMLAPALAEARHIPLASPPSLPESQLTNQKQIALRKALNQLGKFCEMHPELIEREVVTKAFSLGVFSALGYEQGDNIRLEEQDADIVLRAHSGRPLAVIEFKRPNKAAIEGLAQLEQRYVPKLLPDYGVLCNGREILIYRRANDRFSHPRVFGRELKDVTDADAREIFTYLGKRELDLTQPLTFERALRELVRRPIVVRGPTEPGGNAFLNRFALRPNAPFGRLVESMMLALPHMIQVSGFTQGAYAFWRRFYARELKSKDVPESWRHFVSLAQDNADAIYYVMFSLESAYAVLSRLLLVRTMENHGFPSLEPIDTLIATPKRLRKRGRLELTAYAVATKELFEYSGKQAFQSLFASDIFDWWHDIDKSQNAYIVGERLAEAALAVFEFDFSVMSGDLLGNLYQSYFDPDTRKALGEFYTPIDIVDFILDQVGYTSSDQDFVRNARVLDPACGSGTFLVRALQRYLSAAQGRAPASVLQELLGDLKIVGFDINPFAVLMAQANYAAQIIPLYALALQQSDLPSTLSIPVFRTDSLRQEYREGEVPEIRIGRAVQSSFTGILQNENVTIIRSEIPVSVRSGEFFRAEIPVPRYDTAREKGWVDSPEEYFKILRILFDAVDVGKTSISYLRERLQTASLRYPQELAKYIQPASDHLLAELKRLRDEFDDGRFLKTLADLAMALVLKSDVWYDCIVGNPPYIPIQRIPENSRRQWENWYTWAEGNYDIFVAFLERAIALEQNTIGLGLHEWLQAGGRLGYICSNRFLSSSYARGLRTNLPKEAAIELLFDFRDSRVFEEALNYPAIIVARRLQAGEIPPNKLPIIRVFDDLRRGAKQLLTESRNLLSKIQDGQEYIRGEVADGFILSSNLLQPQAWLLLPSHEQVVFEKIEAAAIDQTGGEQASATPVLEGLVDPKVVRLSDLTPTRGGAFQGISTGDDSSLIFRVIEERDETVLVRPKAADDPDWKGPRELEIERAVLRPWLFGRNVERCLINWDGWYVFYPYEVITALERSGKGRVPVERNRLLPASTTEQIFRNKHFYIGEFSLIDQKYPLAWNYVTNPAIETRLRARENGGRFQSNASESHQWYALGYPRNLELYERPKLLMQVSSTEANFAIDVSRHFLLQHGGRGGGTDGIILKEGHNPWFLLGLLNSSMLDFYLKHISVIFGGKTYSYSDVFIKQLPIKLPSTARDRELVEVIAELAKVLTRNQEDIQSKEQLRKKFPGGFSTMVTRDSFFELRRLIQGNPAVSQTFDRNNVSFDPMMFKDDVQMRLGKSIFILPNDKLAQIIEAWLQLQTREKIGMDELLSLRVPRSKPGCQQILDTLQTTQEEISSLKEAVKRIEEELNKKVMDYYGMDEFDESVISTFHWLFSNQPKPS